MISTILFAFNLHHAMSSATTAVSLPFMTTLFTIIWGTTRETIHGTRGANEPRLIPLPFLLLFLQIAHQCILRPSTDAFLIDIF